MKECRRIKIEFDLIGDEHARDLFLTFVRTVLACPRFLSAEIETENVTVTCCGVDISSNYRKPEGLAKMRLVVILELEATGQDIGQLTYESMIIRKRGEITSENQERFFKLLEERIKLATEGPARAAGAHG